MSEIGILPQPVPFGKYYLLERVNIGGMAEIFKAKAFGVEGFERLLAVKKILSSIAEDESFINMFIDEAKIAGQLNHPNIAQIFDLGKVSDSYFIALEYISGKDLKTLFERARRIGEKVSIPRVCYLIMKTCDGLGHAHDKKDAQGNELNIVHRDVSPQNILVSYEGEVKIIDFGIAKAQGKTSQTQVGILKGKFSYMSPEQVRGLHIDHRSDIFSLGIVLYEMLTLERLFLGESDFDTLEKIRKVEMSPPSLYNPHIPKELEDIVLKALAKSPEDRFQTTAEFADALEQFMRNQNYYFTNKDLGGYMKESFSADIEFENKKVEYYRSLNLRPPTDAYPAVPAAMPGGSNGNTGGFDPMLAGAGLSWGDDELDTQIFGRDSAPFDAIEEADIVYSSKDGPDLASDSHDDPPTVEFSRAAISQGLDALSFEDEPSDARFKTPDRKRMPTAAMPAVEPRRDQHVTMPGTPLQAPPKKKNSMATIGAVSLAVIALGVVAIYLLYPWPAEVHFQTTPNKGVAILIDGQETFKGDMPHTYKVPPGQHTIELVLPGHESIKIERDFQKKTTYDIQKTFKALKKDIFEVAFQTYPQDATVTINGKTYNNDGPKKVEGIKAGEHKVKVSKPGYVTKEETIKLEVGKPAPKPDIKLDVLKIALNVKSDPSKAKFTLYDKSTGKRVGHGKTPKTISDLPGNITYKLIVDAPKGYKPQEIEIPPGTEATPIKEVKLLKKGEEPKAVAVKTTKTKKNTKKTSPDSSSKSSKKTEKNNTGSAVAKNSSKPKKVEKKVVNKPKPKGTALLTVASKPVARVYIDGKDTGRFTPLINFRVSAQKHKVELVNKDFNLRKTYYITLKNGESKRIVNRP